MPDTKPNSLKNVNDFKKRYWNRTFWEINLFFCLSRLEYVKENQPYNFIRPLVGFNNGPGCIETLLQRFTDFGFGFSRSKIMLWRQRLLPQRKSGLPGKRWFFSAGSNVESGTCRTWYFKQRTQCSRLVDFAWTGKLNRFIYRFTTPTQHPKSTFPETGIPFMK